MKKTLAVLAAFMLLSLAVSTLFGAAGVFLPLSLSTAKASFPLVEAIPFGATEKPVFPGGGSEDPGEVDEFFPNPPGILLEVIPFNPPPPPTPTPKPVIPDAGSEENVDRRTDSPTSKPTNKPRSGGGKYMTSEGPLFLSFRQDLTDEYYMFTPMDLSLDNEYHFPLIGSTSQVVGEAKVTVMSGLAIVKYYLVNGVSVDEKDEFFTFFPDIRSVTTVKPSQLSEVRLKFGVPYSVASWLNSDPRVLLYINCPVSYNAKSNALEDFSFEDPEYIRRVVELVRLMD